MPPSEQDRRAQDRRARDAAAAGAAAAALAVGGSAGVSVASRPPLLNPREVAQAAVTIIGTALAFIDERIGRDEEFLREQLARRDGATPGDIAAVVAEEQERQAVFRAKAEQRMREQLPLVLSLPDDRDRERAMRGLMNREAFIQRQRTEAMAARAIAAVERVVLRRDSPQGAFWKLDPTVIEHTAGCLVMGGRFWPWAVLDRVHPPRHPGCPCRLLGYGEAIRDGFMRPGAVMDAADAVRAAASVVMEAQELAQWTADDELREALVRTGLATPEQAELALGGG